MESSRTAKSSHSNDSRSTNMLTRKTSNISAAADLGYGDAYRNHAETQSDSKRKMPNAEPEADESNWIHRDKLAQIESRELEEAGFRVPRNTMSRAASSRSSSVQRRDRYTDAQLADGVNGEEPAGTFHTPQDKRQRTMSPARVDEEEADGLGIDFELRTPEEVAAERDIIAKQLSRSGTSRIPVKKASPLPVPSAVIERDAPLTRSRTGSESIGWSGSQDDNDAAMSQAVSGSNRPRTPASHSPTASLTQRSPAKARVPSKTNPTSGNRKTSNTARNASGSKPQQSGSSSPPKRPGTSSSRPSTSHATPEGEPPWLANMYKPDPRLPPDQQILPTHAKRMAQEQWEKEGKTGTVYDREFRLLNDDQVRRPERKSSLSHRLASKENLLEDVNKDDELPTWPLAPPPGQRTSGATSIGRPGTSGTDHGGYSIMPNLNSPKHPPGSPSPASFTPKPPVEVMRVQDFAAHHAEAADTQKKKGGCGCCVVM